ncbi:MAG TPA: AAA family ATPase [Verrucomicrobiae bacterium]|nr:AAA family ATPase [Verrucomicrobiae bacterium]
MAPPDTARQSTESRAARMVREAFESGRPLTYIHSTEEQRIAKVLTELGHGRFAGTPVFTWTLTDGMRSRDVIAAPADTPRAALDFIIHHPGPAIFHLKDFHEPLRDSADIRRRFRDVYDACFDKRKYVVITSPVRYLPEGIERTVLFIDLRPPDALELLAFVREEAPHFPKSAAADEDGLFQVARALQGLTLDEARYALRRALAGGRPLGAESLPAVLEEKRLLVNRSGVIEFITTDTRLGEIGGLELLKGWLRERRKLFQMRDSIASEIVPKGLLMMGIPGCGKSLAVKAIASEFQLPLYRVDMIEIFSGRHGQPEGAFVQACRTLEDMAPAVLWFDEIEMGINSAATGGEQGRIFAFFLTWMQEKTKGLFVAATANRIDLLPAEMIRKGRFDEVFFVDLPTDKERLAIFRIHLGRRGVQASAFNLEPLLEFTKGWAGAEVEQCVVAAITKARLEDRDVTEQDLIPIAAKMVPLSQTMKEQINHIRAWAFERAVRASPQER